MTGIRKATAFAAAALLALLAAGPLAAQQEYEPDETNGELIDRMLTLGVKIGLAYVDVQTEDFIEEFDWKLGFLAGGFVNWRFHSMLALQPEIYFIQKGSDVVDPDLDEDGTLKLSYIEIPVLVKAYLPTEGAFRPHAFVGPYGAFKLSSDLEFFGEEEEVEEVKDTDFGLVFGVGTDWLLDFGRLTFDLRYEFSLGTIWEEPDEEIDLKNRAILFTVGYVF